MAKRERPPHRNPYYQLGFGYIAMANSWVYISCYMLLIVPLLLCGASLNFSANPLTNSYALDTPSKFSISNLQQT